MRPDFPDTKTRQEYSIRDHYSLLYTHTKMAKMKQLTIPMLSDWMNQNSHTFMVGVWNGTNHFGELWQLKEKRKHIFSIIQQLHR